MTGQWMSSLMERWGGKSFFCKATFCGFMDNHMFFVSFTFRQMESQGRVNTYMITSIIANPSPEFAQLVYRTESEMF